MAKIVAVKYECRESIDDIVAIRSIGKMISLRLDLIKMTNDVHNEGDYSGNNLAEHLLNIGDGLQATNSKNEID